MNQIRIKKELVALVLDDNLPPEITLWNAFGGEHGSISELRMLIDRDIPFRLWKDEDDIDWSNGESGSIPIRIRDIKKSDGYICLYYDLKLLKEEK